MQRSANARDRRSALYLVDPERFLNLLRGDIEWLRRDAKKAGMIPAVRLNGTSDLPWERLHGELFEEFHDVDFFDYTKLRPHMWQFVKGLFPANYHLTFSMSERNSSDAKLVLQAGGNVAVVFWPHIPTSWQGYPVIDGDRHDARFLDEPGCVVGLSAKGIAQEDLSSFVVNTVDTSATV